VPQIDETGNASPWRGPLQTGLDVLDLTQEVTFQGYTRTVLPIDGYVFWVPTAPITAQGSLHFSQEVQQVEDETVGYATVQFTSKQVVPKLSQIPTNTIYVATYPAPGGPWRFAFSQQGGRYQQAGLWHYIGHSVYPALAAQLLDPPNTVDPSQAVVCNSLPLWLQLNNYSTPYGDAFSNTGLTIYPSFLVPPNIAAPYVTVHIGEDDTRALQPTPWLDIDRNHWQLCADKCRLTVYGTQNNQALDLLDCIDQYSVFTGNFGIMNAPTMRDAKRTQPEIEAIAMKKVIDFEISYYQMRAIEVARTLILSASVTVLINPVPG
jgi:hypothetical protein